MRQALSGYLNVLFEQNPKAVGGALPADGLLLRRKLSAVIEQKRIPHKTRTLARPYGTMRLLLRWKITD